MADEQRNLEVVGRIGERWNAGEMRVSSTSTTTTSS
jgi:hypothetical protein